MYKLLMVDDEDLIRTGFQTRIDWKSLGFEFLTPCADGRQAQEAVVSQRPDVVITDIAMPHMDGLELTTWLAREYPQITVLVLSGYDDFEFARTSFRNKVFDYILKPVTAQELEDLFRSLKVRLDDQGRPEPQVRRLLAGEMPSAPGTLESDLTWQVAVAEIWLGPAHPDLEAIEARIKACLPETGVFADRHQDGHRLWMTLLFSDTRPERVERVSRLTAQKVAEALGATWPLSLGLGGTVDCIPHIPQSRTEAQTVTAYRLSTGSGIYTYLREKEREGLVAHDQDPFAGKLTRAVKAADRVLAGSLVTQWGASLGHSPSSARRLAQDVQALFTLLADLAGEKAGEEPYHVADVAFGPADLQARLRELVSLAIDEVSRGGANLAERKVLEFQDFISRHYQDLELSLHGVSQALMISPSYLSKILKKRLYRSFVEYITEFRIDRAKELLVGSDLMTYEIAERTGYPDARYFSSIFKKQTGVTPTEFRQRRRSAS